MTKYTNFLPVVKTEDIRFFNGLGAKLVIRKGCYFIDIDSVMELVKGVFKKAYDHYRNLDATIKKNLELSQKSRDNIDEVNKELDEITKIVKETNEQAKKQNVEVKKISISSISSIVGKIKENQQREIDELNKLKKQHFESINKMFQEQKQSVEKYTEEIESFIAESKETLLDASTETINEAIIAGVNEKIVEAAEAMGMRMTNWFKDMEVKIKDPLALVRYCINEVQHDKINLVMLESIRNRLKELVDKDKYSKELVGVIKALDEYCDCVKAGKAKKGDKSQQNTITALRNLQWKLEEIVDKEKEQAEEEVKEKAEKEEQVKQEKESKEIKEETTGEKVESKEEEKEDNDTESSEDEKRDDFDVDM